MRIGIDVRSLQNESKNRGIGTYSRCLIKSLLSIDKDNEYVFFVFGNLPLPAMFKEEAFRLVNIKKVTSKIRYFSLLPGQVLFPRVIKKARLDIFHSTEHILPVFSECRKVITMHDFIGTEYQAYRRKQDLVSRVYYHLKYKLAGCADRIIAVSEHTKKKVIDFVGVKESKVKVIYEAAQETFQPIDDKELFSGIRDKYKINGGFMIYVGTFDHHKNIENLIRGFSLAKNKHITLVMVGQINDKDNFEDINRIIAQLGVGNRVKMLGYIPQDELVGFYNMSKMAISVSAHEGFGLPILEAMACGKAVIAANNTSMKEIVGSCGILVDPYNIKEIAYSIDRLLDDGEFSALLGAMAFTRAKEFSWEKTARQTLSLYEELAG